MYSVRVIQDAAMCILWILTYTLVLIGTIKYRYPLIAPLAQAIIAPFEFSVLFMFHKLGMIEFNYVVVAYLYWAIIEVAIFRAIEKLGYIKKHHVKPYIAIVVLITLIMLYFVAIKEKMFFFSYFNTIVGIAIWAQFIWKNKDYPIKSISLAVFIVKFFADILGAIVYFGRGFWIMNLMSVLLPIIDFFFMQMWFTRKTEQKVKIENIG